MSTSGTGQRRPQVDQSHRIALTLTRRDANQGITLSDEESSGRTLTEPPFWTSWRAAKIVIQGAHERMFRYGPPIRMPCSRSLVCCLVDLI